MNSRQRRTKARRVAMERRKITDPIIRANAKRPGFIGAVSRLEVNGIALGPGAIFIVSQEGGAA